MTPDEWIERLMAERRVTFDSLKEYRAIIERLEQELAEARKTIEDISTGGDQ